MADSVPDAASAALDREVGELARGMPAEVRAGVAARPCHGCGHRRDRHAGWMNLYGCEECDCLEYDAVPGTASAL